MNILVLVIMKKKQYFHEEEEILNIKITSDNVISRYLWRNIILYIIGM